MHNSVKYFSVLIIITEKAIKFQVVLLGSHLHCNGEKGEKHLAFFKKEKHLQSRSLPNIISLWLLEFMKPNKALRHLLF